jgi:RNA polymerase sigma-70 factor (ECF subfamily)
MHDARDAEDTRLLQAGEIGRLVESYYGVVIDRCRVKVRDQMRALDVAHEVVLRLLAELKRGRRYRVPFRVVVHKVIDWKVKEHFQQGAAVEVELSEWLALASNDSSRALEMDEGFESFLSRLTELEQEVLRLRYLHDLDLGEIARRLDKKPNAVHQIHHRALEKLRKRAA